MSMTESMRKLIIGDSPRPFEPRWPWMAESDRRIPGHVREEQTRTRCTSPHLGPSWLFLDPRRAPETGLFPFRSYRGSSGTPDTRPRWLSGSSRLCSASSASQSIESE